MFFLSAHNLNFSALQHALQRVLQHGGLQCMLQHTLQRMMQLALQRQVLQPLTPNAGERRTL